MTMTNELNLSALWDLPNERADSGVLRHPHALIAGSYVTTGAYAPPRFADGTYVTTSHEVARGEQSRGHYVTGTISPSAPAGSYVSR